MIEGMSALDWVRYYAGPISDDEAGFILWNFTGWPCFWHRGDPVQQMKDQIKMFVNAQRLGIELCCGCGEPRTHLNRIGYCGDCDDLLSSKT